MHWSYAANDDGDLRQGDILLPTDELRIALKEAHTWFTDPKYLGFIVIPQTCDLVQRDGTSCKTPYVEIAAIRPFRACLLSLVKQHCLWIGDRYFPSSQRDKVRDLLDRIINQNESALGLFYLHPESSIGIGEESVALLRVSIAMRSRLHYQTIVNARKGRLHPEFANKLGWLCGNLYSRIGIRDWSESETDRNEASEIKRRLLDETIDQSPKFIECPKAFLQALKGGLDLTQKTGDEIESEIRKFVEKSSREKALEAIARVLESQGIAEGPRRKIQANLNSDRQFLDSLKQTR